MRNPLESPVAFLLVLIEAGSTWRAVSVGACSWFVGFGLVMFVAGTDMSAGLLVTWLASSAVWGTLAGLILLAKRRRKDEPHST